MLATDILHRAIPWSRLMLRRGSRSSQLNLDPAARLSALLTLILALISLALPFVPAIWPLPLLALAVIVLLNREFYALCFHRGGALLALTAIPLHALYFLYSSLSFSIVMLQQLLLGKAQA
jgi:hypothetical protein